LPIFFGNGFFGRNHPIDSFYQTGNDEAICLDDNSSGRIALLAAGVLFYLDFPWPLAHLIPDQ
jgi:hypothetical protein